VTLNSINNTNAYLMWFHWLTEHIASCGPCCCSASWVATMCVGSKSCAFVLLKMTVSLSIAHVSRSGSQHFTTQQNWEKCADAVKWWHSQPVISATINIVTFFYMHVSLKFCCQLFCPRVSHCSWEECSLTRTKNVATWNNRRQSWVVCFRT